MARKSISGCIYISFCQQSPPFKWSEKALSHRRQWSTKDKEAQNGCLMFTHHRQGSCTWKGGKRIEASVDVFILRCVSPKPDNAILSVWQMASSSVPLVLDSIIPEDWNTYGSIHIQLRKPRMKNVQQTRRGWAKWVAAEGWAECSQTDWGVTAWMDVLRGQKCRARAWWCIGQIRKLSCAWL